MVIRLQKMTVFFLFLIFNLLVQFWEKKIKQTATAYNLLNFTRKERVNFFLAFIALLFCADEYQHEQSSLASVKFY